MTTAARLTSSKNLLAGLLALPMLLVGCVSGSTNQDTSQTASNLDSSNNQIAFDYFVSKGLSKDQSAGIIGNLDQESGMDPTIYQYDGGPGRGIAQWSAGGRWDTSYHDNVVWYAGQHGQDPWALQTQLDFIWYELTTVGGYGYDSLRGAGSVSDATIAFMDDFERCGACDSSNRIQFADDALADYGGSSGGGGGGSSDADACSEGDGFCTEKLQCYKGHWTLRQDDPDACTTVQNVEESCDQGDGYCTATLQCDGGHWVPRSSDSDACTSGPG